MTKYIDNRPDMAKVHTYKVRLEATNGRRNVPRPGSVPVFLLRNHERKGLAKPKIYK